MARRGRKPKSESQESVVLSPKDEKIFNNVSQDMSEERKDEWMKRRAAEDRAAKENNITLEEWYVKKGDKLIFKKKKKSGGCYAYYVGNWKKNPNILTEEVKSNLKEA